MARDLISIDRPITSRADKYKPTQQQQQRNNMPGGQREFDRHESGTGTRGLPKKDGLKGWGKEGEEDPVKTSRNDPNYAEEGEQHISANEIEKKSMEALEKQRR
ncbi:hypothetical protein PROFUN_00600 [Planoprotostelium fungivorum]|uniref:Hyaluronan/mRNA-binding protein domain-containing protein n=1 Tax=Planoprotostelium fungivorum TaxID=1890364 RepID=A0A2P6NTU3_9EUKA|nr:hypothetical protein PROFUN_00600 [Planoprotostelium fungivorum]